MRSPPLHPGRKAQPGRGFCLVAVAALCLSLVAARATAQSDAAVAAPDAAQRVPSAADAGVIVAAPSPDAAQHATTEVTVRAAPGANRERSARSLRIVELEAARRSSADLGQILAQTEGVSVRRTGALGAPARLSLAGLIDEQIPIFVDGVPIEMAGYPFGIANVPVSLLERVEVHRGVVPLRLGSDALGGALDLITDTNAAGPTAVLSYQGGSFDTHRAALTLRYRAPTTGLFVRADGFFDRARNDYPIRVDVFRDDGSSEGRATVRKRNDDYRAGLGSVEAGFVDRPWARRLLLRVSHAGLRKGVPHNLRMTVPYGRVRERRGASTVSVRFESVRWREASFSALAAYARRTVDLLDRAVCTFDWYGRCLNDTPPDGELGQRPFDQHVVQHGAFARLSASYAPHPSARLEAVAAFSALLRTGRDQAFTPDQDALRGRREAYQLVGGLEHRQDAFAQRLQNILSLKYYGQFARSEQWTPANGFIPVSRDTQRFGVGDGMRVNLSEHLFVKAAYEWATRLPAPDQMFGDGVLVEANLQLQPERSHNVNLGLGFNLQHPEAGEFRAFANGFGRLSQDLIYLMALEPANYANLARARTWGVEANAGWVSKHRYLALTANATYQDPRNAAASGPDAKYRGDRVPNRPYLFANASALGTLRGLFGGDDELSLYYQTSYVHPFSVGWSIDGDDSRLIVPKQLVHSLGAGLLVRGAQRAVSMTLDIHNLGDARVFDLLGAERPGRTVFAKLTLEV